MQKQNKASPYYPDGLPEKCYATLPYSGRLVLLERGIRGFMSCTEQSYSAAKNRETAKVENRRLGVSKAQETAMIYGSRLGFEHPEANPANYDKRGVLILNCKEDDSRSVRER